MNEIQSSILALLPPKRKLTPSGWTSFNAPCCHNRGEGKDTRQRGGILLNSNGGFQYHCFNCNFKAGWNPGQTLTKNTKSLFKWIGISESEINKLALYTLKLKEDTAGPTATKTINLNLENKNLPENSLSIKEWLAHQCNDDNLVNVLQYIQERGFNLDSYNWHWSPNNGYNNRLIIPFYHQGNIVGWTARRITPGKPKYLTESQPGYVFNLDNQNYDKKYMIVVEGQLDAIAVDGVAIMHNEPNEAQCSRINALGKEIILVPDKDKPGAKLINAALEHNWSVSLPSWEDDIKDVSDAAKRYGRLYTLFTILHYRETNKIKIQLLKKKLEGLNE